MQYPQMSKSKQLKSQIKTYLARMFISILANFSLKTSHLIGSLIGYIVYLTPNKLKYSTETNIRLCFPRLTAQEQKQLVRQSLIETGKTLTEASQIWQWDKNRLYNMITRVHGEDIIEKALAKNNGVIIAFPHLGTWELLSLYCSSKYPMTTLYRKPRMQQLDSIVKKGRESQGAKLVPTDHHGVRAMFKALQHNEIIGILPDQEPGSGNGVFAPFFGIPAYSMTLVSRLARKTNAEVIVGYAKRLPDSTGFEIFFTPAPAGIHSASLEDSVTYLNTGIEKCILETPEQYQWSYKRFRTRPTGEPRYY